MTNAYTGALERSAFRSSSPFPSPPAAIREAQRRFLLPLQHRMRPLLPLRRRMQTLLQKYREVKPQMRAEAIS